jgi:hypothetical protein
MLLENPALVLNIGVQDILGILEKTLREKNWRQFELANLKLTYQPYYIFNYDVLIEQEVEGQPFSQSTSGITALNAVTGRVEPTIAEILEKQPVNYEKEIAHDLQYELLNPAITREELTDASKVKLAAQFNVKKENIAVSGFRLVYWPIWRIFVSLPEKTQKVEIDAVAGYPLNFEEVPEKEVGWIEITQDMLEKMKSPAGWAELAKMTGKTVTAGAKTVVTKEKQPAAPKTTGAVYWLAHTKKGRYTLLFIFVFIILVYLLFFYK